MKNKNNMSGEMKKIGNFQRQESLERDGTERGGISIYPRWDFMRF